MTATPPATRPGRPPPHGTRQVRKTTGDYPDGTRTTRTGLGRRHRDGVIGASTAYNFARLGWSDVLLHSLLTPPYVTLEADHRICDNTVFQLPDSGLNGSTTSRGHRFEARPRALYGGTGWSEAGIRKSDSEGRYT